MRRTILVIGLSAFGALLACASLLGFLVVTGEPRALTTAASAWVLSQAIGTETEVGRSSGSILRGLELSDLEIGPAEEARFVVERARLEIEPRALLDGRLEIRLLRLSGLSIEGIQQPDGRWRWAGGVIEMAAEPAAPGDDEADPEGQTILLHALLLEDVRFHLAWAGSPDAATLDARLDAEFTDIAWPPASDDRWLPPFEARLSELELSGGDFAIASGSLAASHAGGDFLVSASEIEGPWGEIASARVATRIEGDFDTPRMDRGHAEAEFVGIDPGSLLDGTWPASNISGRTLFDWEGKEARGEMRLDPLTLFGVAVDSSEAHGRVWLENDQIGFDIETLQATAAAGALDARVAGDAARAREIVIRTASIDLAALPDALRPDGVSAGRVTASGRLSGPWDRLTGDFELRAEALEHADLGELSGVLAGTLLGPGRVRVRRLSVEPTKSPLPAFSSKASFVARFDDGRIGLDGARFEVAGGELGLDGSIDGDRLAGLRIRVADVDLERGLRGLGATSVGGALNGEILVDGPLARPIIEGELDWIAPRAGQVQAERARLVFTREAPGPAQGLHVELVHDADLALEARATFSTAGLLQRPMGLLEDRSLRLEVEASDLDAGLLALSGMPEEDLPQGRLDAQVTAHGPLLEPLLEGRVEWTDAVWRNLSADRVFAVIESNDETTGNAKFDFGIEQDGRSTIHGVFEVADRRLFLRPTELLTNPDATVEIVFDGFDLSTLDAVVADTGVFVRGVADGRVRVVAGPLPATSGEIRITDLTATGPALPFDIGPTPARFEFAGQVARMKGLELPSSDGPALIRGQVSWADPAQVQLQLRARTESFAIELPGIINGRLDGDAFVFGTPKDLTGEGSLLLHHARIDLPDPEDPIFREISIQYAATDDTTSLNEDSSITLYDALEGQISLQLGESVWLRGVGAELELSGELVARKQRDEPAGLYGNVEVISGRIDFQGKWLRVTSGSAVFDGNADPDPYIDATAQHRVADVSIRARLFGRASALALELDSDPPMSPEDQISYLLFDRPTSEIGSIDQQSVGAMAAVLASDFILGQVGNEIVQEVGIDRVRLGVDENDSPTIEVEKQVHERVTLRYGRGFGPRSGDRFVVEWRLFRELFLSGEQLTNGESGVDVFWRRDY